MTDTELSNFSTFDKATRCTVLYQLLCDTLGLDPLSPSTTWRELIKLYSITMEDAHKLQYPEKHETVEDSLSSV